MKKSKIFQLFSGCWSIGSTKSSTTTVKPYQETWKEDKFVVEKKGSEEETKEAYQALITLVEAYIHANLPPEEVSKVADEVLSVLKTRNIKTPRGKKAEIEKILNPIPDFIFNQLVSISKLITNNDQPLQFVSEQDFYQPNSDDTYYKLLLTLIRNMIGVQQPQIVECLIAHDVLEILKDKSIGNHMKRNMLESSLNSLISTDTFDLLLNIGELVYDSGDDVAEDGYLPQKISNPVIPGFQDESCDGDLIEHDGVDEISDCMDDDQLLDPTAAEVELAHGQEKIMYSRS